jgi:hypothetical protein
VIKFPFSFGTKLIFRIVLPGALLAAVMAPLVHAVMRMLGVDIRLLYTFPFEAIAWGWLIVTWDMFIYMLFEGRRFWPDWLRRFMIGREQARLDKLSAIVDGAGADRRAQLEAGVEYTRYPMDNGGDPVARNSTRLGNLIDAYEDYPKLKYGLDAVFYWPRLWLSLDKDLREEIDNAQSMVDSTLYVAFILYVAGFVLFVYAAVGMILDIGCLSWLPEIRLPYVPPPGVLVLLGILTFPAGYLLYRTSLHAHAQFGELFKAAFDQFRSKLDFDDVLKDVGRIRGTPYVSVTPQEKNMVVWRYLRWHRIRDDAARKNFKVKDWPRP